MIVKPFSGIVALAAILTIGGALVAAASGFGHRLQLWGYLAGFKMLFGAAIAAAVGTILALITLYGAWRSQQTAQLYWSVAALAVGLVVIAPVLSWARTLRAVPYIHDISTDTENPPAFVAILKDRANAPNTAEYGGPEIAKLQHAAYPDLKPLRLAVPPPQAFAAALAIARGCGWKIVATDPGAGRIEASDRTFWYGFIDDIVIRVTPVDGASRVDVRSVSRVGKSDLGTNARRVRGFLSRLSKNVGSAAS